MFFYFFVLENKKIIFENTYQNGFLDFGFAIMFPLGNLKMANRGARD